MIPRKLNRILDKDMLCDHFYNDVVGDDRRLRFGGGLTDEYVYVYLNKAVREPHKNMWFVVEDKGRIVATCHTAYQKDDNTAELGLTVSPDYRNQKLGQQLFDRGVTWARMMGAESIFMHCLSENGAMKHIARKNDMAVVTDDGESDANVHLEPANALTPLVDSYADRMALYDMMYKNNIKVMRNFIPKYWYESKSN